MGDTMSTMNLLRVTAIAAVLAGMAGFATDVRADIIDDLKAGHCVEIPRSAMRDVCPPNTASYHFNFYCTGVTDAWGGAALDTTRGRLVLWGGGHGDYKGNEIYVFDTRSLTWERTWGPTAEDQIPEGGTHEEYDDGNPGSRHTYSGLSYVPPPVDALLSMGGALWESGNYAVGTWSFSFQANSWTRKTDGPEAYGYGDPSAFDPQTGHVFRRSNTRMLEYDPVGDTFADRAESDGGFWQSNVAVAIDPDARLMVFVGEDRLDLYHLDTDQYEQGVAIVGASVKEIFDDVDPGIAFDTNQDKFILWGGGLDVYSFDPETRSFQLHQGRGDDPGPVTTSGGVFGRFRYVPSRNVFIRVNTVDENVFAFRLAPGTGTPLPEQGGGGGVGGASSSGSAGGATVGTTDSGASCATVSFLEIPH